MKKILLIIAILLVILLVGLWGYLLLYGRPSALPWGNSDFAPEPAPTNTGSSFSDTPDTPVETTATIPLDGDLIELSSRPTAGAALFTRDGGKYVRYVERGTGHVFEIDLGSGVTERISNTTIPRTTDAVWNRSGTRVAITFETAAGAPDSVIGTLLRTDSGAHTLETAPLPALASNLAFTDQGDALYYTLPDTGGATGYRRDLKTDTETALFSIPLREIIMLWDTAGSDHFVHTKPSAVMTGHLYRVEGNALSYVRVAERGLVARRTDNAQFLLGRRSEPGVDLAFYDTDTGAETQTDIKGLPEKCVVQNASTTLWCFAPLSAPPDVYPDAWYQGAVSFHDYLWRADRVTAPFVQVLDLGSVAREPIDGMAPALSEDGTKLVFINKRDGTLWLVNLDRLSVPN